MKRILTLACLVGSLLSVAAAAAEPNIVPGKSIGKIALGMNRSAIYRILGSANQSHRVPSSRIPGRYLAGRYEVATWWKKKKSSPGPMLTVTLRNNRVVQIETDSAAFTTAGGTSLGAHFSALRNRYPHMRVDQYGVGETEGGGFVKFYMDSVRRGIAFTQGTQDDESTYDGLPTSTPESIIIHLRGQRVIPTIFDRTEDVTVQPPSASDYLPDIRAWFAGGPHRKVQHHN